MTTRSRWDETRALIEAGWHRHWKDVGAGYVCDCGVEHIDRCLAGLYCIAIELRQEPIDWDDIKRAEADADRMLYGDAGAFMRGGEPGC